MRLCFIIALLDYMHSVVYVRYMVTWLASLLSPVARLLSPAEVERQIGVGAAGVAIPTKAEYPTDTSMSAIARFPWVRACVQARASDLAGLPLIAVRVLPDGSRERLPLSDRDAQVLRLLSRPNPQTTGNRFRRQLSADLDLTGNAFILVVRDAMGPAALYRLHPSDVQPIVTSHLGIVSSYRVSTDDGHIDYPHEDVLHIADISWRDGRREVLGESRIRTLHHDLLAVMASKDHLTKQAQRGRPTFLATPKGGNGMGPGGIDRLSNTMEERMREGKGMLVVGAELVVTPLNLTARDMEFGELESRACEATLAVFDVPLVRVHKEGANYGTAKQQMRNYWESLQHGAGRMFDDAWSLLTGDPTLRIEHDFTAVEALQLSRTERLDRAAVWVSQLGATPDKAAVYEGFQNSPASDKLPESAPAFRPGEKPADEPRAASLAKVLEQYLQGAAQRYRQAARDGRALEIQAIEERGRLASLVGDSIAADVAADTLEAVRLAVRQEESGIDSLAAARAFGRSHAVAIAQRVA